MKKISAAIISTIGFKKTHLEDEHVIALFSTGRQFPCLKNLDLSDTRITAKSLQLLVQSHVLSSLIDLRLRGVQGSSGDFIVLIKSCVVLERMSFSRCKDFNNRCLQTLSNPRALTKLSVNETAVSDDNNQLISDLLCEKFVSLRVLRVKGNTFSSESVGRILQKLGLDEIEGPCNVK